MGINYQITPFKQRVTMLNDNKYCLIGDPIEGSTPQRPPKLFFEMRGNYPYLNIRLNNGTKDKDGRQARIELALDMVAFEMLLSMMEDSIRAKEPMCQYMEVKRRGFDPSTKKPTDPYVYAIIAVGKDADGCEFIGIQRGKPESKNHIKLKFNYLPPEFHNVVDNQGMEMSRSRTTNIVARGWVRMLSHLLPMISAHVWEYEKTWEGKQAVKNAGNDNNRGGYNNNNGGGYNNNNYNNGSSHDNNNNSSSSSSGGDQGFSFDDDVSF